MIDGKVSLLVEILVKTRIAVDTPEGLKRYFKNPPVGKWVVAMTHIIRGGSFRAIGKVVAVEKDNPYGWVDLELLDRTIQRWKNEGFFEIAVPSQERIDGYLQHQEDKVKEYGPGKLCPNCGRYIMGPRKACSHCGWSSVDCTQHREEK